ncbi:MAG TPA: hypothetical protein PLP04_17415 [Bryobacteraceae bacterium]|nr:hypothetical protein [Bryobacteraceae bacterium]
MKASAHCVMAMSLVLFLTGCSGRGKEHGAPATLVRFDSTFDFDRLSLKLADAALTHQETLRITTAIAEGNSLPEVVIRPRMGKWDLSGRQYILFNVKNTGLHELHLSCWLEPAKPHRMELFPREEKPCYLKIYPTRWTFDTPVELHGFLQAAPGDPPLVNPHNIAGVGISVLNADQKHSIDISEIQAGGWMTNLKAATFFPFIDEYGQYSHEDWPGKIHSLKDFVRNRQAEERELAADPGPVDRSAYGGWTRGPQLAATGFFRVEKYGDKWWFVDPEGYLFWSFGLCMTRSVNEGPDSLVNRNVTPLTGREHYFLNLPPEDSVLGQFYGTGNWAPRGYYKGRTPYRTYDFAKANLFRKYGPNWPAIYNELVHRRFRSWGINTLGHRSDRQILMLRNTPYVASIDFEDARFIEGSEAFVTRFFDVFDPSFRKALRAALDAERGVSIGDPWCLGFFVNHEIAWGEDDTALALAALRSPADQPAKIGFVQDLRRKYGTVARLNAAWDASFESWDELLAASFEPDRRKARADLLAFNKKIADTYFRIVRQELKSAAPNQLYLGCRFAGRPPLVLEVAAAYTDVVSFSVYDYTAEYLQLPGGIDKPILISEFHFGALDRGLLYPSHHTMAINQQDRAARLISFVEGALKNPYIVGAHWFQYRDEPTAGRGDGENYQCGFVDICDTPYPETIRAARLLSRTLYPFRIDANREISLSLAPQLR